MVADTYPSMQRLSDEDRAESLARERNLRDLDRLTKIKSLVDALANAMIPLAGPLEHPDLRRQGWGPEDLCEALLSAAQGAADHIRQLQLEQQGPHLLTLDDDNGG